MFPRRGLQFLHTPVGGVSRLLQTGFNQGLVQGWWWSSQGPYYRVTTKDQSSVRNLPRYGPNAVLVQGDRLLGVGSKVKATGGSAHIREAIP